LNWLYTFLFDFMLSSIYPDISTTMASHDPLKRLSAISGHIGQKKSPDTMAETTQAPDSLPWNPDCTKFPSRKDLPQLPGAPEGAAWVWGEDDQVCAVGDVNSCQYANDIEIAGKVEPFDSTASQGLCSGDTHGRDGTIGVCKKKAWRLNSGTLLKIQQSSSQCA
jgi:hypothetical protein